MIYLFKRFAAVLIIILAVINVKAQDTSFEDALKTQVTDTVYGWKKGGNFSFQFSQVSFVNWAAGGDNSVSGISRLDAYINLVQEKSFWNNKLVVGYGMQNLKGDVTKTDDRLNFTSQYGRNFSGAWYYSGLVDFKTQMDIGYSSDDADLKISNLLSPAYLFAALGLDLKKGDNFSLFMAPLTLKSTFVLDQALSDSGSFGLDPGEKSRYEIGGYIKFFFSHEIMKNIDFQTKLDLFSNYLNKPQNIDVFWELILNMKVNNFISAQISTNLIYDDDIMIAYDSSGDGVLDAEHPILQFKELVGVGLLVDF